MGCGQSTPGGTVAQPTANAPAPKEQAATGTAPKPHTSEAAAAPAAALGTTKAAERKEAQTHQGDVNEKYQMGKALGSGSFATARIATHKETKKEVAIKSLLRNHEMFDLELLDLEIKVMKRVGAGDVVGATRCIKLYEVFEDKKAIHLVEELASGGELFDRILDLGHFSEKLAATVIRQVLQGIAHMHSVGCVHRDLKPENLLMLSPTPGTPEYDMVKIADFGLSSLGNTHDESGQLSTVCGTPDYIAPEIVIIAAEGQHSRRKYDAKVDVWAIGVILYTMLCGFPPFWSETMADMLHMIKHGDYSFPSPAWDHISQETKDYVSHLLTVDPHKRPTATEALEHPWIAKLDSANDADLNVKESLGQYMAVRRGKKVFNAVLIAKRFELLGKSAGNVKTDDSGAQKGAGEPTGEAPAANANPLAEEATSAE